MRTESGARRTGMLAIGSIASIVVFTWWRANSDTGCMPFTRPGGQPGPPFDWWVAKATLPPLAILVVGAFVALGARKLRWLVLCLFIVVGASLAALLIGMWTFGVCT
jgi:hypothetical protein